MKNKIKNPMIQLADHYADELTAQFRTLNYFVEHAGEIGRVHEIYLRGVIERFLPNKCGIGTGFVHSKTEVSTQQDIIIYNRQEYPCLFHVGDCIVVDLEAVAALLEVKTRLKGKEDFLEVYRKLVRSYEQVGTSRFVGLFVWDGLSLDSSLSTIWGYLRENPLNKLSYLPNAIYVRSKYLLLRNKDGRRETPPFRIFEISKKGFTEGQALLTLMVEIWMGGLQGFVRWPWWLEDWWRNLPEKETLIPWPQDLQQIMDESLDK